MLRLCALALVAALSAWPSLSVMPAAVNARSRGAFSRDGVSRATEHEFVCAECHAAPIEAFQKGRHAGLATAPLDEALCARCHGDCTEHADSGDAADVPRGFTYQKQDAVAAGCATCHARAMEEVHHWSASDHLALGKRCLDCHRVHRPAEAVPQAAHPGRYRTFAALAAAAEPVGAAKCAECHPSKQRELGLSAHAAMLDEQGCEVCHGEGSLHVMGSGTRRHVLRPDRRSRDAVEGCRSCHADVHPTRFHWPDREVQLGRDLACAMCHRVHWSKEAGPRAGQWVEAILRESAREREQQR